jgi:hypothetical protein
MGVSCQKVSICRNHNELHGSFLEGVSDQFFAARHQDGMDRLETNVASYYTRVPFEILKRFSATFCHAQPRSSHANFGGNIQMRFQNSVISVRSC